MNLNAIKSTGSPSLDLILGGGLQAGLFEVWGPADSAKSSFALALCREAASKGLDVLYWDLDNTLTPRMVRQVTRQWASHIRICQENDTYTVYRWLQTLLSKVQVLVLDSLNSLTLKDADKYGGDENRVLYEMRDMLSAWLHTTAMQHNVMVLGVNQERFKDGHGMGPGGGAVWRKYVRRSVRMTRSGDSTTFSLPHVSGERWTDLTLEVGEKFTFPVPPAKRELARVKILDRFQDDEE